MTKVYNDILIYVVFLTTMSVVLEIGGIVHWSWWWVLSPLWAPILLVGFVVVGIVVFRLRDRNYW